jgi:hypothetical protein
MKVEQLKRYKLKEPRYFTFIKNIVLGAVELEDKSKVVIIMAPEK